MALVLVIFPIYVKLIDLTYILNYLMHMKLSHLGLEAFYEAANCNSISQAADRLGLTQSALSQRIMRSSTCLMF